MPPGWPMPCPLLHEAGVVHARISPNTIYYSLDHPAKLGGVGPPVEESTFSTDVVQLVDALEQWAIGRPSQGLPLSELVDGVSPAMDHILADAAAGELTSSELAARLAAAPAIPLSSTQGSVGSRVGLWLTAALIVTAVGLVGMGTLLSAGSASTPPTLESTTFQTTTPQATTSTVASPTTTLPSPEPVASPAPVLAAAAPELLDVPVVFTLDPYGGGGEMDHRLGFLVDGDRDSTWRTERVLRPAVADQSRGGTGDDTSLRRPTAGALGVSPREPSTPCPGRRRPPPPWRNGPRWPAERPLPGHSSSPCHTDRTAPG